MWSNDEGDRKPKLGITLGAAPFGAPGGADLWGPSGRADRVAPLRRIEGTSSTQLRQAELAIARMRCRGIALAKSPYLSAGVGDFAESSLDTEPAIAR